MIPEIYDAVRVKRLVVVGTVQGVILVRSVNKLSVNETYTDSRTFQKDIFVTNLDASIGSS